MDEQRQAALRQYNISESQGEGKEKASKVGVQIQQCFILTVTLVKKVL